LSRVLNSGFSHKVKKYRYSLEIVKDMLLTALVRVRKTRIMYQANLSYRLMEKYLNSLLDSGLLECDEGSFYLITGKGKDFLQMYDDYLERCKKINDDANGVLKHRLKLENMCSNSESDLRRVKNRKDVTLLH